MLTTTKPPKRLRISHRFYAVVYTQGIETEGFACYGLCQFDKGEILIDETLAPEHAAEILLHEVLHAIHNEAGLTDASTEEDFTTLGAKGLCRFIQDNPTAWRWLTRNLNPKTQKAANEAEAKT